MIRRHYFRLSPVCGSIAWAGLSQLPCLMCVYVDSDRDLSDSADLLVLEDLTGPVPESDR